MDGARLRQVLDMWGRATGAIRGVPFDSVGLVGKRRHGGRDASTDDVAYGMNGGELPVEFGGPLRLRVPRQLGYKSVKYITRVTVTDSLKGFGKGLGSASPEGGYAWYAGI